MSNGFHIWDEGKQTVASAVNGSGSNKGLKMRNVKIKLMSDEIGGETRRFPVVVVFEHYPGDCYFSIAVDWIKSPEGEAILRIHLERKRLNRWGMFKQYWCRYAPIPFKKCMICQRWFFNKWFWSSITWKYGCPEYCSRNCADIEMENC